MPYIKPERRNFIFDGILAPYNVQSVGELNYLITSACLVWMEKNGKSYKTINDIIGVLECAKQEFYRKAAAPYEEDKEQENGSIY